MQIQVYCSKIDKFKNNRNAYHENIDFYNMTHMRVWDIAILAVQ
jgi:CMP-N-acetylneuraminic acid synthetase